MVWRHTACLSGPNAPNNAVPSSTWPFCIMPDSFVYLASQSPRRAQLLDQIGVAHQLLLPDADEDAESLEAVLPGEAPRDYVQRVTLLKLQAALQRWQRRGLPPAPVLCADTTVALGSTILGKPADAQEAVEMLTQLSGQQHQVLTAVAVGVPGAGSDPVGTAVLHEELSVSQVTFDRLDAERIAAYVATGEPFGKAGAYGVQGHAATLIAHIDGSFSGIMGLPLFETARLLRRFGWRI